MILRLLLILLALARPLPAADGLPPVQPKGSLCSPPNFAAALGASLAKATGGRIVVTFGPVKWHAMVGQGQKPACTGAAWVDCAGATPLPRYDFDAADALKFWRAFRNQNPKAKGDENSGAYMGDVVAVLVRQGYIAEKPKTLWNATMLAKSLAAHGPCLLAIPIFRDMYWPAAGGFLHPTGVYEGDHCLVALSYDPAAQVFTLGNSWTDFAPHARFANILKVTFAEMELLMRWGGQGIEIEKRTPKVTAR